MYMSGPYGSAVQGWRIQQVTYDKICRFWVLALEAYFICVGVQEDEDKYVVCLMMLSIDLVDRDTLY
jgi:hypothetical protein